MDKKKQIAFNLNNFLLATSNVLDLVEKDVNNISLNHSKRVAYVALNLARAFNLSAEELSDLCSYSLVHSIALFKTKSKNENYCILSDEYCLKLPFLTKEKSVLKYQCEKYDGSGIFKIKGEDIPLMSQLIFFASFIDSKFDFSKDCIKNREEIKKFVKQNKNILFSSDIVEVFEFFASQTNFWLELQNESEMLYFIFSTIQDFSSTPTFEELLEVTTVFSSLVDDEYKEFLKIVSTLADSFNFEHKDKQTFLIAASLCNIGKLSIPSSILEKEGKLSEQEYEVIKAYPFYTKKVLSNIMGFNDINTWACKIQESLNANGYPFGFSANELSLKDRLLAVSNIYHALKSKRVYRDALNHNEAIKIMRKMANDLKLDKAIVEHIDGLF